MQAVGTCDKYCAARRHRERHLCLWVQAVNMFDKAQEEQMALAEKKRVVEEDKAKILEVGWSA
jgi:hypothetical protein